MLQHKIKFFLREKKLLLRTCTYTHDNLHFSLSRIDMSLSTEMSVSQETREKLIKLAAEMEPKAYCPYSKFHVGAALLADDGKIYTGVNVENQSYGLCICAERTAAVKMVSEGGKGIKAIAVSTAVGYVVLFASFLCFAPFLFLC